MFHLYIKGVFFKAYETRAAAQCTVAKKFRQLASDQWEIREAA